MVENAGVPGEAGPSAIILAGGSGTRLGALVADRPKPMLPVAGRPFVEHVVLHLRAHGIRRIVFSSGYRSEVIRAHFGDGARLGLAVSYADEPEPLGTGGAIRFAASSLAGPRFLVLNGDSFLAADPNLVLEAVRGEVLAALALVDVSDGRRFGGVEQDASGSIVRFTPAAGAGPATINAGVYGLSRSLIGELPTGPISLEGEVLPALVGRRMVGVRCSGFFVDIGVPESYAAIQADPGPLLTAVGRGPGLG